MQNNLLNSKTQETLHILGCKVRALRKSKGWTQEQFAEQANINDKEVTHIEAGRRNITIETLIKIAMALGVNITYLISE